MSTVLLLDLVSSPALFTDLAYVTHLIMLKHCIMECEHYIDDYITVGPPDSHCDTCQSNLDTMVQFCVDVGFDMNPS